MKDPSIKKFLVQEALQHNITEEDAYQSLTFTRDFLSARVKFMVEFGAAEGAINAMHTAYSMVDMVINYYEKESK